MNGLMEGKMELMLMEGEGKLKWGIYMKENLRREKGDEQLLEGQAEGVN